MAVPIEGSGEAVGGAAGDLGAGGAVEVQIGHQPIVGVRRAGDQLDVLPGAELVGIRLGARARQRIARVIVPAAWGDHRVAPGLEDGRGDVDVVQVLAAHRVDPVGLGADLRGAGAAGEHGHQ